MGPRSGSVEAVPLVLYSSKRRKLQRPELAANTLPKSTVANNSLKQATKPAAKSTAKFVPLKLAEIPLPATSTPVVVGTVPIEASILITQEPWRGSM